ncbi:MAG: hypothetical protein N2Z21_09505 [Candidatus Sumerlaeaceae bacterium]|nr:hypothetical protein [Candidatus Sumerlaeaceae bacterium]
MAEPIRLVGGRWYRASSYRLVQDKLFNWLSVVPDRKARLEEYDPFSENRQEPIYKPLVNLFSPFKDREDILQTIKAEQLTAIRGYTRGAFKRLPLTKQILEWCNRYGLLGLLHEAIILVRFWPRWDRAPVPDQDQLKRFEQEFGPVDKLFALAKTLWEQHQRPNRQVVQAGSATPKSARPHSHPDNAPRQQPRQWRWIVSQKVLARTPYGWTVTFWEHWRPHQKAPPRVKRYQPLSESECKDLVPESDAPATVVSQLRHFGAVRVLPFKLGWGRYFPTVPVKKRQVFGYPEINSPQFWRLYGEPVEELAELGWLLAHCILALEGRPAGLSQDNAAHTLAAFATYGAPYLSLIPSARSYRLRQWHAGSLLASVAHMILEDLSERRVAICASPPCQQLLSFRRSSVRYCSQRCRAREIKRRLREKSKRRRSNKRAQKTKSNTTRKAAPESG